MAFDPAFKITPRLLRDLEAVAEVRAKIAEATIQVAWVPQLQKDSRHRGAHASTAIEGNPLTLPEVRALEAGTPLPTRPERARREILNYFAGLRFVEKRAAKKKPITHEDIFRLHRLLAAGVMDQGEPGSYRSIRVRVGGHLPPPPEMVSGLMRELLDWWNKKGEEWPASLSSAICIINSRRFILLLMATAAWDECLRSGSCIGAVSTRITFSRWMSSTGEDRTRYYESFNAVRRARGDLTGWLEYTTEGLRQTLERVWLRVQQLAATTGKKKTVLRPKQEQLLHLLRDRHGLTPNELWAALDVTKQGAAHILRPLLKAKLVKRIGTQKNGRYILG